MCFCPCITTVFPTSRCLCTSFIFSISWQLQFSVLVLTYFSIAVTLIVRRTSLLFSVINRSCIKLYMFVVPVPVVTGSLSGLGACTHTTVKYTLDNLYYITDEV